MKRILYADDEPLYHHLFQIRLAPILPGAVTDFVNDGQALLNKFLRFQYDLIFTDYRMAEMDGLRATTEIRRRDEVIPVYVVSDTNVKSEALLARATGFLDKSQSTYYDKLSRVVLEHLR